MTSRAQHAAQLERTAQFARIIRDLQSGVTVDLSTESTFSLQDMEFQAELSRCEVARAAILAELDRREALEAETAKGAKCYWDGGSRLHGNPHADDTPQFAAWLKGWNDAQAERWERDCPTAAMLLKSRTQQPGATAMTHTAAACPNPAHCIDAKCYAERTARFCVGASTQQVETFTEGQKVVWSDLDDDFGFPGRTMAGVVTGLRGDEPDAEACIYVMLDNGTAIEALEHELNRNDLELLP